MARCSRWSRRIDPLSSQRRRGAYGSRRARSPAPEAPLDLDAIEARARAATSGPWKLEREELSDDFTDEEQDKAFFSNIGPWEIGGHHELYTAEPDHDRVEADAALMEHAQQDILALVAEARRLRAAKPSEEKALKEAIRAITVDLPDDQPNGTAEKALLELELALDPVSKYMSHGHRLDHARQAAARLCEALADDTKNLRIAAEAYFGGDFRAPEWT